MELQVWSFSLKTHFWPSSHSYLFPPSPSLENSQKQTFSCSICFIFITIGIPIGLKCVCVCATRHLKARTAFWQTYSLFSFLLWSICCTQSSWCDGVAQTVSDFSGLLYLKFFKIVEFTSCSQLSAAWSNFRQWLQTTSPIILKDLVKWIIFP